MARIGRLHIRHKELGIVPREVTATPDTPEVLLNISVIWEKLAEQSKDEGYFTVRAGFYFVYKSKLWFLYAPGYTEGHYMPYVDTICQHLIDAGATGVEFDEGELD